jgi:hypothetical protein
MVQGNGKVCSCIRPSVNRVSWEIHLFLLFAVYFRNIPPSRPSTLHSASCCKPLTVSVQMQLYSEIHFTSIRFVPDKLRSQKYSTNMFNRIKSFILGIICRFVTQMLFDVLRGAHRWSLLSARNKLISVVIQNIQLKSGPLTKPRIFHVRCYL